jgi:ATP-dependent exoDNAse (exonuclease V) alpha subunit
MSDNVITIGSSSESSDDDSSGHTNKRQRLSRGSSTPKSDSAFGENYSSLLHNLDMAPTSGGPQQSFEDNEVGDEMQLKAISLANKGSNVFLTGRAGTGKSWATKRIIKDFESQKKIIYATAPTGIAAINVDGTTIHNWGRFNLGQYCEYILNIRCEHNFFSLSDM